MGENAQDPDLDEFGNNVSVPESLVFFWDTCATRLALICRVIDRAGARGVKLDDVRARTRSPSAALPLSELRARPMEKDSGGFAISK